MTAESATKPGLDLSHSQQAAIEKLAKDENVVHPPIWLAREAVIRNDASSASTRSLTPDDFWAEKATGVEWMEPFDEVCRFEPPRHAVVRRRRSSTRRSPASTATSTATGATRRRSSGSARTARSTPTPTAGSTAR